MREKKNTSFFRIISEVRACTLCDRMRESARVLNFSAGNLHAKIMFIGEAPGRRGADLTEVPFHGDAAGVNFEDLLVSARIQRDEIFITNAVLCNPKNDQGYNGTPLPDELQNCSSFLRRQIELVDPAFVVTLGSVALKSTAILEPHSLILRNHVRTANQWFGRILIPLYHPGQRAMLHRSLANQRSDYQFVADRLRKLSGHTKSKSVGGTTKKEIMAVCHYFLEHKTELSYFELHKLAYLAEYLHVRSTGRRLTNAFFIRQKDGPYCTDLHITRLKRSNANIRTVNREGKLYIRLGTNRSLFPILDTIQIEEGFHDTLDEVIERYSFQTDADLKKAVYLTAPMRFMLRREKREKINLHNSPIDFLTASSR